MAVSTRVYVAVLFVMIHVYVGHRGKENNSSYPSFNVGKFMHINFIEVVKTLRCIVTYMYVSARIVSQVNCILFILGIMFFVFLTYTFILLKTKYF